MAARRTRIAGLLLLAAWAGVVAFAFQRHHPTPWSAWTALVRAAEWNQLVPALSSSLASLGRLLGATGIVVGAACAGRLLIAALTRAGSGCVAATAPERFWVATVCGLAAFSLGTIALAAGRILYAPLLWLIVFLPLVIGTPGLWRWLWASPSPHSAQISGTGIRWVCIVVLAGAFFGAVPIALSPQVLHDSQVYHLALPQAYLEGRRFVHLPHLIFANTPLNTEMLYAIALSLGGPPTAKLLHLACGLGTIGLTVALGRRLHSPTVGWLAALFTLTTPVVIGQLPSSYVDLAAAFAFTATVWLLYRWKETSSAGALSLAALALGFFAGMRYTAVYGVTAVLVAVGWILVRQRSGARLWLTTLGTLGLGLLVGAGPWLLKNAAHVGNPVFPIASGLFGIGPLTETQHARMQLLVAQHGMGHELIDLLLLPWRLTVYGNPGYETFDGAVSPLWLIALPAVLTWRTAPSGMRLLGLIAAVYFLMWTFSTHVARYLIPAMPLFSLLSVGALWRLAEPADNTSPSSRRTPWALAGLVVSGIWWMPVVTSSLLTGLLVFGPVTWGRESTEQFLWGREQTAPVYAYMARHLPPDARIIGLWENRSLRCPRPLEGDAVYEAPRWLDLFAGDTTLEELASEFRRRGFTHLLLNTWHLERYPPRPVSPADERAIARGLRRLRTFTREHCQLLFDARGIYLYEIEPVPREDAQL